MDPTRLPHAPHPLAPDAQTACYSPWLKARVLIRAALTIPWSSEDWPEIRQSLSDFSPKTCPNDAQHGPR
jgi:hypothetical protein